MNEKHRKVICYEYYKLNQKKNTSQMSELFLDICKKGGTDIVRTLSSIKYLGEIIFCLS